MGTFALRMLLCDDDGGASTSAQQQMLRGETADASTKVVTPINSVQVSESARRGNSDDVYKWAYEEDVPSKFNMFLGERSLAPSRGSDSIEGPRSLSGAVSRRTNLFSPEEEDEAGFSLRLYWRDGYYWQEVRSICLLSVIIVLWSNLSLLTCLPLRVTKKHSVSSLFSDGILVVDTSRIILTTSFSFPHFEQYAKGV